MLKTLADWVHCTVVHHGGSLRALLVGCQVLLGCRGFGDVVFNALNHLFEQFHCCGVVLRIVGMVLRRAGKVRRTAVEDRLLSLQSLEAFSSLLVLVREKLVGFFETLIFRLLARMGRL
jgi:hypothetical protein